MCGGGQRVRPCRADRGHAVTEVDLAPFVVSGGAFCMTLRLDLSSHR